MLVKTAQSHLSFGWRVSSTPALSLRGGVGPAEGLHCTTGKGRSTRCGPSLGADGVTHHPTPPRPVVTSVPPGLLLLVFPETPPCMLSLLILRAWTQWWACWQTWSCTPG